MKHINKFWLAAMSLAFVACQNEDEFVNTTLPEIQSTHVTTLTGVVGDGTRAQIVIGNQDDLTEKFFWNEGDRFTLYQHKNIDRNEYERYPSTATFDIDETYSESNPSGYADFSTTYDELLPGDAVTAIYPLLPAESTPIQYGRVYLNIENEIRMKDGSAEEWRDYFSRNMYMAARDTVTSEGSSLRFEHLTCLFRITYTNGTKEEQKISNVNISGRGTYWITTRSRYDIINGYNYKSSSYYSYNLIFENLVVAPGESKDLYFLSFATDNDVFSEDAILALEFYNNNSTVYSTPLPLSKIAEANGGKYQFEKGKRYWFNLTQVDKKVMTWDYTNFDVPAGTIENLELIKAIEDNKDFTFNKDENGFVDVSDKYNYSIISNITELWLCYKNLTSLEGIEYFTYLKSLQCYNNNLTSLDLSKNIKLEYLECQNNQIEEILLPENSNLWYLSCSNNKLKSLDLSKTGTYYIYCDNNELTELNLSNRTTDLIRLVCHSNHISNIDISEKSFNYSWSSWKSEYEIRCGKQTDESGNPKQLNLSIRLENKLNDWGDIIQYSQQPLWALWYNSEDNKNVVVEGFETTSAGSTGDNFGNGGDF